MRMKSKPQAILRWGIAEFLGTCILAATAITASVSRGTIYGDYNTLYVPFAIGIVLMLLVYLFGPVSGAHFNPAVSVAMVAFRKMSWQQFVTYIVAQFAGAWAGVQLAGQLLNLSPYHAMVDDRTAAMGEFAGAFILVFGVAHVALGKVKEELSGVVVGASIITGLTLALTTGGGVLNPAIAAGLTISSYVYLLLPILAGLAAVAVVMLLSDTRLDKE